MQYFAPTDSSHNSIHGAGRRKMAQTSQIRRNILRRQTTDITRLTAQNGAKLHNILRRFAPATGTNIVPDIFDVLKIFPNIFGA